MPPAPPRLRRRGKPDTATASGGSNEDWTLWDDARGRADRHQLDSVRPDRAGLRSRVPAGDRRRLLRRAGRARPGEGADGAEREVHRADPGAQARRRTVEDDDG